jgi:hypothetical protein
MISQCFLKDNKTKEMLFARNLRLFFNIEVIRNIFSLQKACYGLFLNYDIIRQLKEKESKFHVVL